MRVSERIVPVGLNADWLCISIDGNMIDLGIFTPGRRSEAVFKTARGLVSMWDGDVTYFKKLFTDALLEG